MTHKSMKIVKSIFAIKFENVYFTTFCLIRSKNFNLKYLLREYNYLISQHDVYFKNNI